MSREIRARFMEELNSLTTYYVREYNLSYIEMLGSLRLVMDHLSEDGRHGKEPNAEGEDWKS